MTDLRKYARSVARIESRLGKVERSAQTGFRSIEGGRAIEIRDTKGDLVGSVGTMPDGSIGSVDLVVTAPPTPTAPEVVGGVESIVVRWDGGYEVAPDPAVTVAYVGVHFNQNPEDLSWAPSVASELAQITAGGGEVVLSGDAGVETAVVLVAVSAAGSWSDPTEPVEVIPGYAADIDIVADLVEEVEIVKTDGLPPGESPTPVVTGGSGVLYVDLPMLEYPDPTDIRVYVSATTPVVASETTFAGTAMNGGTVGVISADGAPLTGGETYYAATIAVDADGDGPLSAEDSDIVMVPLDDIFPITETQIEDESISTPKLQANSVTAEKVATDVLVVNDVFARDGIHIADGSGAIIDIALDGGILQTYANGTPRINFPIDPTQPNQVRSELITDGLTAEGRVAFRGQTNEISRNGRLVLQNGVTAPANTPTIQVGWLSAGLPAFPASTYGMWRDGTSWIGLQYVNGANPNLIRITDAGVLTATPISLPQGFDAADTSNVVKVGSDYYFTATSGTGKYILKFNSGMSFQGYFGYPSDYTPNAPEGDGQSALNSQSMVISSDGTNLYTTTRNKGTSTVKVHKLTTAGAVASSTTLAGSWAYLPSVVGTGPFDFGSFRYLVVALFSAPASYDSAGARVTSEDFSAPGGNVAGLGWDGTRFFRNHTTGTITKASTLKAPRTVVAGYDWYDTDPVGGNFESLMSPLVTFTQPSRCAVQVSTPPPNDDGTSSAPDSARVYMGATISTLKLQGAPNPILVTGTFLDVNLSSGAAPPTVSTFPDGLPASVAAATPGLVMWANGVMQVRDPLMPDEAVNKGYSDSHGYTDVAWVGLSNSQLQGNWFNFDLNETTWQRAGYEKRDGVTYVNGMVKDGDPNTTVLILPVGMRPRKAKQFSIRAGAGGLVAAYVFPDGRIVINDYAAGGNNSSISLDGITFVAKQ